VERLEERELLSVVVRISDEQDAEEFDEVAGHFTIARSGGSDLEGEVAVSFQLSGTATAGRDYEHESDGGIVGTGTGTFTIPDGVWEVDLHIRPFADHVLEGDEQVVIALQAGSGYTVDPQYPGSYINILDDGTSAFDSLSPFAPRQECPDVVATAAGAEANAPVAFSSGPVRYHMTAPPGS
jgi:hypothetical protein